jgi:hypothetical protein
MCKISLPALAKTKAGIPTAGINGRASSLKLLANSGFPREGRYLVAQPPRYRSMSMRAAKQR